MEEQKRKLNVCELSFNSFYEFSLERIPQITGEKKIEFNINTFAAILEQFYRGGELETTLNNDTDRSLFEERFIVFEVDKIKDDPVLFPIVVLIIMKRSIITTGYLENVPRTQNNPHGLLITNWRTLENKDLDY